MGRTEGQLAGRLGERRRSNFDGITHFQIHVRIRSAEQDGQLTASRELLRPVGAERDHRILVQALPWETTDPGVYGHLLDLDVASFATDHPKLTPDAVRDYYARKSIRGDGDRK